MRGGCVPVWRAAVLSAAAIAMTASAARADDAADDAASGVFSAVLENDSFYGPDGHYTNGGRLSWTSATLDPEAVGLGLVGSLPFWPEGGARASYALGQSMFTPKDTSIKVAQPDDRPYAGHLYAAYGLAAESDRQLDQIELSIGVVGPASIAEETQRGYHALIGVGDPQGWEGQLQNEFAIMLSYQRTWRAVELEDPFGLGLEFEAAPQVGGAIGNVHTYANVGAMLRLGSGLDKDFGPARVLPGLSGSGYFEPADGFGWYLFAGVDGRAVGHNIFLDGNSFRDSPSVDKRPFVGDLQFGAAVTIEDVRLSYTHVMRTREFEGQTDDDSYGSVNLSVGF